MPFTSTTSYTFDENNIKAYAPVSSGVYGLFVAKRHWVYIGETNNLERRLLEHLSETGTCLSNQKPTHFTWELSDERSRVSRQNALILELRPVCNQKLG